MCFFSQLCFMGRNKAHPNPLKAFKEWNPKVWSLHILFWVLLAILLTIFSAGSSSIIDSFLMELLNMLFYASLVYFNIFYLIPKYLSSKKLGAYIVFLVGAVVAMTMAKVVVFYFFSPEEIKGVWLKNQSLFFLSFFLVTTVSTIAKIIVDWARYQREKQEIATKTVTSELQFLRSQINPHFLFNTLNSLYALTLKKSDIAPEIVLKLSEMMRYMLYECNEKTVLLSNEVNYIKNYLDLERLRHGAGADIQLNISGEIKDQRIAPLFFIPFLENSFKHGLNHQLKNGFVHIDLQISEKKVHFSIQNSKPEQMPLAPSKRAGGFGLANVKHRLKLIYPDKHELRVMIGPQAYEMDLVIEFD